MSNPLHYGWFFNFSATDWCGQFSSGESPWTGDFYVEMAQQLERVCFDYLLIEDTLMVPDIHGGSFDAYLKAAMMVPKHDPVPLATIIAAATSKIGVVPTMSTTFYPPFLLARLAATCDHIAGGRFGWNIVTSGEDSAAQNFGMDKLIEHDLRYDMADEYVELCCRLWDSWDPDAVVLEQDPPRFARGDRVRAVDFEGRYFKSRGPLNTVRPPSGRPTFVQAGRSPRGRQFAAKWADSIVAVGTGVKEMKAYRDDVRRRAEEMGRKPDDIKLLFLISPIIGETSVEAAAKAKRMAESAANIEANLLLISSITDIDFSKYSLDEELPDLSTNGERTALEKFVQRGSGKTLRELAIEGISRSVDLIGTPDEVAEQMGEVVAEVGGDGFLITYPGPLNRRYIAEITDGLMPALQRRGMARTSYTYDTLRENLLDF